jgi:hypothetical protein
VRRHENDVVADDISEFLLRVAPWVMHKKRGEVNGKHVCEDENVMRQEASE